MLLGVLDRDRVVSTREGTSVGRLILGLVAGLRTTRGVVDSSAADGGGSLVLEDGEGGGGRAATNSSKGCGGKSVEGHGDDVVDMVFRRVDGEV